MSPSAPFLAPSRDDGFTGGRAKRSGETYIGVPGASLSASSTATVTANRDYYAFLYVKTPIVVDQLISEVTTLVAASNFRIGMYRADRDWQPVGVPLADSGNLSSATTGVKTYTPATPLYLAAGRYLSVINSDASPAVRVFRGIPETPIDAALGGSSFLSSVYVSRAYAAFPSPGTAWDTDLLAASAMQHYVLYRVLTP
jgi:hypothetical protein